LFYNHIFNECTEEVGTRNIRKKDKVNLEKERGRNREREREKGKDRL
jgi:hypothetical protein